MVKLLHAADLHLDSAFSALPPEKAVPVSYTHLTLPTN